MSSQTTQTIEALVGSLRGVADSLAKLNETGVFTALEEVTTSTNNNNNHSNSNSITNNAAHRLNPSSSTFSTANQMEFAALALSHIQALAAARSNGGTNGMNGNATLPATMNNNNNNLPSQAHSVSNMFGGLKRSFQQSAQARPIKNEIVPPSSVVHHTAPSTKSTGARRPSSVSPVLQIPPLSASNAKRAKRSHAPFDHKKPLVRNFTLLDCWHASVPPPKYRKELEQRGINVNVRGILSSEWSSIEIERAVRALWPKVSLGNFVLCVSDQGRKLSRISNELSIPNGREISTVSPKAVVFVVPKHSILSDNNGDDNDTHGKATNPGRTDDSVDKENNSNFETTTTTPDEQVDIYRDDVDDDEDDEDRCGDYNSDDDALSMANSAHDSTPVDLTLS